ncbi:MAG TPA: PDZ domain-containing protein, partial [Candidatus Binatia bacterium]|nr:PDZ domain-containing protein [Candidatus Binatia bacterium]
MREGEGVGSPRDGVGVLAVTPGSPAARAGIVAGDRILSVSG